MKVHKISTIVGANVIITGTLCSEEDMLFDGTLNGNIVCTKKLVLANNANILGDIDSMDIDISGKVTGNIKCRGKLYITSSGTVKGDICASSIVMDEGATFDGKCKMIHNDATLKE